MTANSRADTVVSALDAELSATLGVRRVTSLEDFLTGDGGARYLLHPDVRIAHHFDIHPPFLILDPLLGSLGIVGVALPPDPTKVDDIRKIVRRHIDTATYARHLLLRAPHLDGYSTLTVELTLLTADETASERQALETIGEVLRDALRGSDSLFQVGVGVLCYSGGDSAFKEGSLRRAFPWLLKATQGWLASPHSQPASPPKAQPASPSEAQPTSPSKSVRHLRQIRLSNYRLPGVRHMMLASARVHLVHGPNESGKSSIVEALELVSSGTVERLQKAGEKEYNSVIKNRHSPTPATIELTWSAQDSEPEMDAPRFVVPSGLDDAIDKTIPASSFRLDQPLMDRLIGQFPHERARHFLQTFFSEAGTSLNDYTSAADARKALSPKLERLIETLERGKQALTELRGWRAVHTPTRATREERPLLLNRWLEKTAALDLVRRERTVRSTVRAARAVGWMSDDTAVTAAVDALDVVHDVDTLDFHEQLLVTATDDLQKRLATITGSTTTGVSEAAAPNHVSVLQAQALNAVGRWMFSADVLKDEGAFGDNLTRVINAGDPASYGTLSLGGEQWAETALQQLDALVSASQALEKEVEPPKWPGSGPCPEYDEVANAQRLLLATGKTLSKEFIEKMSPQPGRKGEFDGSLIAAINELMALFTPARWSYSDIRLPSSLKDGKLGVNIELGEHERPVRAELHLNTAELNLFTVALFLLCATRVHKPLNVLLFDDPLQNMDELTSTALARGLAKVIRQWAAMDRTEEVLLFFHGNDDLERFAAEVPAARYQLPWLTPSGTSPEVTIDAKDAIGDVVKVQTIKNLVTLRGRT